MALANESQDIAASFESELANADVTAALHSFQQTQNILEHVRREAIHRGYLGYEFEADLRLGKVQMKSGNFLLGRARLARLKRDASAAGFTFIARQATL